MAHKGAIKTAEIERRFAVRIRVRVPGGGLGEQLDAMHAWLNQRAGRDCYRIWSDQHADRYPQTTAVFLDDVALAAELVARFGLLPAPATDTRLR